MATTTVETATIWVCIDCRDTEASGQLPDGFDEDGQSGDERRPVPWSAIEDETRATPGLIADEHSDDCPNLGLLPCPAGCDDGDANGPDEPYAPCPSCDGTGRGPRMDYDGGHDEPCEDDEFSWIRCDGCASTLGGSRHAYTLWLE